MDIGRTCYPRNRGRGGFTPMQGWSANIQAVNAQATRTCHVPGNDAPCFKCGSIEHWARNCPMAQANLIDFDEAMTYDQLQGNANQAQMTAEELKQTLYNLTPQQCTELASMMVQQVENFPSV